LFEFDELRWCVLIHSDVELGDPLHGGPLYFSLFFFLTRLVLCKSSFGILSHPSGGFFSFCGVLVKGFVIAGASGVGKLYKRFLEKRFWSTNGRFRRQSNVFQREVYGFQDFDNFEHKFRIQLRGC
jgi:hypothetical protein